MPALKPFVGLARRARRMSLLGRLFLRPEREQTIAELVEAIGGREREGRERQWPGVDRATVTAANVRREVAKGRPLLGPVAGRGPS